jgi:hypothetical protein
MSLGSSANGMDNSTGTTILGALTPVDFALIEVSPDDGTTWYQQGVVSVTGSNVRWSFGATGAGSRAYAANNTYTSFTSTGSGLITTGTTTATVTGLPSVANLRMRITLQCNSSNESWIIDDVSITGTPFSPVITGTATANAFTTTYGTASTAQTFSVSGTGLSSNLVATAPAGFEVSSDGTAFGSTASFAPTVGNASGTLSVRLAATAPVSGSYDSLNIVLSSTGATPVNIVTAAIGNVVNPMPLTITANPITKPFGDTLASPVTGSTAFTSSGLAGSETIGSVTITYGTGAAAGDAVGAYADQVTPSLATGGTFNISNYAPTYVSSALTVTSDPTISAAGALLAVNTTYGTPSFSPASFTVSGIFLTGDLTVTPPSGFEVSTSIGSGYTTSLILPASGTLSATSVYVRLAATTGFGTYSGNVTVSGGGATSQTIATAPSSVAKKALTITGLSGVNKPYDATLAATTTGTPAYVGLENGESLTVTGTASAVFASAGAGTAKPLTVTGYTDPNDNYTVSQPTGLSADITQVELTITAPTIADKVYNGNPNAGAVTVGTLSGFVGSETVTATATAAAYPSANAATYSGTVITYTLQDGINGGLAANYSLPNGTADGIITPRPITITANSVFKNVGATLTGGTGSTAFTTSNGPITPETIGSVTITYGAGAASGDSVDVYPGSVTPSDATGGTFTPANYNITYVAGDLTVTVPLIAGWDFQTTATGGTAAAASPGSPTVYNANFGSGTIYLDGTNGSSTWTSLTSNPQVTSFAGTTVNAASGFSTTTSGASSLVIANSSANSNRIAFKFSMSGRAGLLVSYATQRTTSGFTSHLWEFSTDGTTWTTAETISSITSSYASVSLASIAGLDRAPIAYLRLTVSGATTSTGNNRIDNLQIRAADAPAIESLGTVAAFTTTYGTASTEQTFAISGFNLSNDITATAPSGFEVSSDGNSYASTAIFTQSGGTASGSLRVRLAATAPVSGSYDSQNIVLTSSPAPSVNITTTVSGNIISKATPTNNTAPTASAITSGQTLADSVLTGGSASVAGSFAFTTPSTIPAVGTASQSVTFSPTDSANFNTATTTVSVTVNPGSGADPLFTDPTKNAVLSDITGGGKRLSFIGISGRVYGIERSGTLTGWTQIGTVTAPESGAVTFDDANPPQDKGFYRIVYPAAPN